MDLELLKQCPVLNDYVDRYIERGVDVDLLFYLEENVEEGSEEEIIIKKYCMENNSTGFTKDW